MLKSAAMYAFFKKIRHFDEVSLMDMVAFPMNRGAVREAQGDYQIEQGLLAIERGDYFRARNLLQQGVARSPANLEGRMLLIQLFAGWRTDLALQLLENGYEYGKTNPDFIRSYCSLLLSERRDSDLLELTGRILDEPDLPQAVWRIAAISRMQAAIQRGEYELATETYRNNSLYETPDGILLACDVMARLGQTERAVGLLEALIHQFPDQDLDAIHQRLVQINKNLGNLEQARQRALNYAIRNPERWQARILLIESLAAADPQGSYPREARAVMRAFGSNEQAMRRLGSSVTERADRELAATLYEIAVENFFEMGGFSLMRMETSVRAGEFREAIDFFNEWQEGEPTWLAERQHLFTAMRALAYFGLGDRDRGHFYLNSFRNSRRATAEQLMYIAGVLNAIDLEEAGLTILETAHANFPNHERILSTTITQKIELGESARLADQIAALLELRRPDYSILQTIYDALSSDRFIYTPNRAELITRLGDVLAVPQNQELDLMPPLRAAR